jgi:hypothetical protein
VTVTESPNGMTKSSARVKRNDLSINSFVLGRANKVYMAIETTSDAKIYGCMNDKLDNLAVTI